MKDPRIRFIKAAIRMGLLSVKRGRGGPFGCVIVHNGKIIARAGNAVTLTNDPTDHAEIRAIRKACRKLKSFQLTGCEVYCSSEPCPMCLGAIYWARPSKVFFSASRMEAAAAGFDDDHIYQELRLPPGQRTIPCEQVPVKDAAELFRQWLANPDKRLY